MQLEWIQGKKKKARVTYWREYPVGEGRRTATVTDMAEQGWYGVLWGAGGRKLVERLAPSREECQRKLDAEMSVMA